MDRPLAQFAAGLPVSFEYFEVDGDGRSGVPGREDVFVALVPDRGRSIRR